MWPFSYFLFLVCRHVSFDPLITIYPCLSSIMRNLLFSSITLLLTFLFDLYADAKNVHPSISDYDVTWLTQSANSSESMPCGGGEQGMNIWCQDNDLLFYFSRSSAFDENNALLKLGRVRLHLPEAHFEQTFKQRLTLSDGRVRVYGANNTVVTFWADVFHPVIHIDITSDVPVHTVLSYDNWRISEYGLNGENAHLCGMKGTRDSIYIHPDSVSFLGNDVLFYHRNRDDFVFQRTVDCEELQDVKDQLWNPVKNRTFGGVIHAEGFGPCGTGSGHYEDTDYHSWNLCTTRPMPTQHITITTHIDQSPTLKSWLDSLLILQRRQLHNTNTDSKASLRWWADRWQRSFVYIDSSTDTVAYQLGRNYQLFRYMLACNAYGDTPTKFNGSLFTFDPHYVKSKYTLSPDFRQWGGAVMTAQNQRLVYWPMLKNGDWDMMDSQFNYYLRARRNAEYMTQSYWHHEGACFTEQIENFGLPAVYCYGMEPRTGLRPRGKMANPYCEYLWDTVMDFCLMMVRTYTYEGRDVKPYLPFIESCLTFFDEHYRMLALQRTGKPFDRLNHYVFYPGTAGETYKMAYNSTQTIAALSTVLRELLTLPSGVLSESQRTKWQEMLGHMPSIATRIMNGHTVIAPAQSFERIMNIELNQLYPVFPYDMYGLGRPNLELARDTWRYGIDNPRWQKNRYESWHQDAIFCARLGLLPEARKLVTYKLRDGRHRFPAFFGPGHDWTPDHNWGGTGMIAMQEMLMQTVGDSILLLPCWPKDWNVHFKLHAPKLTTVECTYRNGHVEQLSVTPTSRRKDVIVMLDSQTTSDSLQALRSQPLNNGWHFQLEGVSEAQSVNLPHTWNAIDAQDSLMPKDAPKGSYSYKRCTGTYTRQLLVPSAWKGLKRIFVRFEGASQVAHVYLNGKYIGEHKGAFTAFCLELTDDILYGESNELRVEVDNRWRADLAPLSGGFAVMGGLYRPAELLVTDRLCISPLHYGSKGIYVDTGNNGQVTVRTHLNYGKYSDGRMTTTVPHVKAQLKTSIFSPQGQLVCCDTVLVDCSSGADEVVTSVLHVPDCKIWQGKGHAPLYTLQVAIASADGTDRQKVKFGFRHVSISKADGFMLNGKPYPVRGVSRHQDKKDKGWAMTADEELEDMRIMDEMGVTAIRMAHYPQSEHIHQLADSMGFLVWDEIPLVNDVRNSQAFIDNARNMMMEMMCQLYNHPSVCWWGLFNEIDYPETPYPRTIFHQLNDLAHQFGGNRLTSSASNKGKRYYDGIADAPAWNNYPGWYWMLRWPKEEHNNGHLDGLGTWMDYRTDELGGRRFGISEYGAGGNPNQHLEGTLPEQLMKTLNSDFHPEEWQTHVHEEVWRTIKSHHNQLWGTFVWAMFDFIVPGWSEGGMTNLNTKGLVTHDRKTRKDAFYFYQANWTDTPMVHICSARMKERHKAITDIKVYSTCPEVTLYVNGRKLGTVSADDIHVCHFKGVTLTQGVNKVMAVAKGRLGRVSDTCEWTLIR
jgi:hypothetical protein